MFFYTWMPRLFNMSLTASIAIMFILLLRLLLKKAPKVISYALWGIVLFRLLCPISIGSDFSLYNLFDAPTEESGTVTSVIEYVPGNIVHTAYPSVALPVPVIRDAINEALPQGEEQLRADPPEGPVFLAAYVWMAGVLIMVLCSLASYVRLRSRLSVVLPLRDNIFIADDIQSPFVVGLFRPRIYLPCNLGEQEQAYIILHEQHHIKRLDYVMKALAFLALTIHWFNPLVWLAFQLACRDMEMSCDEAVIRKVGSHVRADYAASLLSLATGRRIMASTPLAFGEGDTKGRIKNLSKWKRPAVWIIVLAAVACILLGVGLLTNPIQDADPSEEISLETLIPGTTYVPYQCLYMNPLSSYGAFSGDSGCKYIVGKNYFATIHRGSGEVVSAVTHPDLEMPISDSNGLQNMIDVPQWNWQAFPYSDEEWAALYQPGGIGAIDNISERYEEILYQRLVPAKFLLKVDGDLWLVELASNEQMGTYLWSIYSLVPEAAMGVAQWEYAPMLSSRLPYFRFTFDLDYTELSAVCIQSPLVDLDAPGAPSDTGLTFHQGNALYWSPINEDGSMVSSAVIHFTATKNDVMAYSGTIYLDGNSTSGGRRIYTASIVGTGLHLAPHPEQEGGVISAVSPGQPLTTQYDLTEGSLRIPEEDLENYVFYTNSTRISVTVEGNDFQGQIHLLDISQNNARILQHDVNPREDRCRFTGLTSARMYRVECEGLEGRTLVISD